MFLDCEKQCLRCCHRGEQLIQLFVVESSVIWHCIWPSEMRFGTVFRPICCYLPLYRGHILWFDTVSGFEDTVSNHMFGFENTVSNHENNCCDLTLYSHEIQCQITLCSWNTVSNRIYVLRNTVQIVWFHENTVSNHTISWEYSVKPQFLGYSVKSHFSYEIQCQIAFEIQC